ncbi:MaoC family dehydratase [Nonomuraea cavernae]|uniref:3-hydroxyacyl-thioester dehydratase HtdY n=1 Tax=Nonomuraea cavernae TaxID=2045107 RepID=A0A917Z9Q0_9ACTN|nr:MaoC family dehydratase [Nonomuraea cavernae]MCA2190221.1 enoyl-CoA hydratase [Nonomuraea cavernae]GGO78799.1 3-hydroxyacyl-thioester dehydratase HtdY [Nonomuraea cavernae]
MPLDHGSIGVESPPHERSWTAKDTMLYALGVGAGVRETVFSTEKDQRVLPTFAVLAAQAPGGRRIGDFDPAMLVHAEQGFELHRELPPAGRVRTTSKVTGIYDKGSGALVTSESLAVDPGTGEPVITSRSAVFIRGEGGFGGDRGPRDDWSVPERAPDHKVTYPTTPDQALIYRLSGDYNPLHSDPEFAARAGFDRPILHGLCTYGVTGRALLHAVAGSDPARFGAMSGRFTSPVFPGESLTVSIWVDGPAVLFRTAKDDGTVVIDRGRAAISARPAP